MQVERSPRINAHKTTVSFSYKARTLQSSGRKREGGEE